MKKIKNIKNSIKIKFKKKKKSNNKLQKLKNKMISHLVFNNLLNNK